MWISCEGASETRPFSVFLNLLNLGMQRVVIATVEYSIVVYAGSDYPSHIPPLNSEPTFRISCQLISRQPDRHGRTEWPTALKVRHKTHLRGHRIARSTSRDIGWCTRESVQRAGQTTLVACTAGAAMALMVV